MAQTPVFTTRQLHHRLARAASRYGWVVMHTVRQARSKDSSADRGRRLARFYEGVEDLIDDINTSLRTLKQPDQRQDLHGGFFVRQKNAPSTRDCQPASQMSERNGKNSHANVRERPHNRQPKGSREIRFARAIK